MDERLDAEGRPKAAGESAQSPAAPQGKDRDRWLAQRGLVAGGIVAVDASTHRRYLVALRSATRWRSTVAREIAASVGHVGPTVAAILSEAALARAATRFLASTAGADEGGAPTLQRLQAGRQAGAEVARLVRAAWAEARAQAVDAARRAPQAAWAGSLADAVAGPRGHTVPPESSSAPEANDACDPPAHPEAVSISFLPPMPAPKAKEVGRTRKELEELGRRVMRERRGEEAVEGVMMRLAKMGWGKVGEESEVEDGDFGLDVDGDGSGVLEGGRGGEVRVVAAQGVGGGEGEGGGGVGGEGEV